jgi:redox-sensitive bicupin YhaK (pirin superfamily)
VEIVSYVLEGELVHQDSMGNGAPGAANSGVIRPGDVQRMSAGSGVTHSESNHSTDQVTHFLQIWILPDRRGIEPGYEQRHFDDASKRGRLLLIVSQNGRDGSVTVHADASIYAGLFDAAARAVLRIATGRLAYVHIVRGEIEVNGQRLAAGDAAKFGGEPVVSLANGTHAEVLVFDLLP